MWAQLRRTVLLGMLAASATGVAVDALAADFPVSSSGVVLRAAQTASQPAPAEEFVPIDELPPEERLPAAPLLIAAYIVAWLVPMGYLLALWRRLGRVEKDLSALEHHQRQPGGR